MSIFVPHNIESRKQKLKQVIYKLLQNEIIEGDLIIDQNYDFKEDQVKVRIIKGDVIIRKNIMSNLINNYARWNATYLRYIPEWLKNVEIQGNFNCWNNGLFTLENCPQYITGDFICHANPLRHFEYGPIFVGGNFITDSYNNITEHDIINRCKVLGKIFNG